MLSALRRTRCRAEMGVFSQRPTPPFATHQHCARGCGGASDLARTAAPWAFISQTPVTRKHCNMDAQGRKYARISERGVRPNGVFFPGRVWKGLVCEFPFPSRPDPARPDPTGHFDPRVSALKMADLGPPVLAPKAPFGLKNVTPPTTSARGIRFRHSRGLLGPSQVPFWQLKKCISTKQPPKAPFELKVMETLIIPARGIRF